LGLRPVVGAGRAGRQVAVGHVSAML